MRFKSLFITLFCGLTLAALGCGGTGPINSGNTADNGASNGTVTNGGSAATDTNNPVATTKTPEPPTTNNAPTLGPIVQAFYDAMRKKDDAGIRKLLSAEFTRTLEASMKEEKKTNLAAFMAETDGTDKPIEVRNERINGDEGVVELRGGQYLNWIAFGFIKENGTWRFSGKNPSTVAPPKSGNK